MKKFILFFVISLTTVAAKAQGGYDYSKLGLGVGVGYGRAFADTKRQDYHPSFNFGLIYNYEPYIPIALEFQFGTLSGGGRTIDKDPYGRIYKNNYKALILHADLQAGAIMDYSNSDFLNMLKNFYVGTGIGAINNKMVDIQRTNLYPQHAPIGDTYGFEGKDKSTNLLIPLRFGYEFKIFDAYDEPSFTITLGYQHNITFGEGLDGYNDDPDKFKNNSPDQYGMFTIGFKYSFLGSGSYTKSIKRY